METPTYISIDIFCRHHRVDSAFINSLADYGLIEIHHESDSHFIAAEQLAEAERMTRLYQDLQVNTEGIDIIVNLLRRMKKMQDELTAVQNRLRLYEAD